jgi:ATP-dependent RNA helicase DDX24/MAK5
VVLYQVPQTAESYVHKSGRTARMNKRGFCLVLVGEKDTHVMRKIQYVLAREIPAYEVYYQKFQQCVEAVKMATEIATSEFRKKKQSVEDSWVKRSAEEAGLEDELPTKRQKKKNLKILKQRLQEIQKEELNITRGSVITPALYKKAKEMKLI